jgi:hypothetical protein
MQLKVPHFEPLKLDLIKEENKKVLEAKYFSKEPSNTSKLNTIS